MSLTVVNTEQSEAERKWGYQFGIDGTVDLEEAAKILGGCDTQTVERRIAAGFLRVGKDVRRVIICKRSLMQYLARCEK